MMRLIDLLHQSYTCAVSLKTIPVTFGADNKLILNEQKRASGAIQPLLRTYTLSRENM